MSREKEDLALYLAQLGFLPEVRFPGLAGNRRWRWDWATDTRPAGPAVAVEYHGVVGVGRGTTGGHQSIRGTWNDHEKVTEGQLSGFTVIQCNVQSVRDGRCYGWIDRAIEQEGAA